VANTLQGSLIYLLKKFGPLNDNDLQAKLSHTFESLRKPNGDLIKSNMASSMRAILSGSQAFDKD
jgi:hypothetical protein